MNIDDHIKQCREKLNSVHHKLRLLAYKEFHWAMWNWLAKNPGKYKSDWDGWAYIEPKKSLFMFIPCAFSDIDLGKDCTFCPVIWPNGKNCWHRDSPYERWMNRKAEDDFQELAKNIRDLEWKIDDEEEKITN